MNAVTAGLMTALQVTASQLSVSFTTVTVRRRLATGVQVSYVINVPATQATAVQAALTTNTVTSGITAAFTKLNLTPPAITVTVPAPTVSVGSTPAPAAKASAASGQAAFDSALVLLVSAAVCLQIA